MKKGLIVLIIIVSVLTLLGLLIYSKGKNAYNTMVEKDEIVVAQWSQVENQYKRRADLIPNLVKTVKGYADFEQETLTAVIEARSKATSVTIDPTNMDGAALENFQQAQGGLSSALSRLMVVVERYPDLKANQSFLELQAQLEGTENRISFERKKFIESTRDYNIYIRKFPNNIFAGFFGFEKKANLTITEEEAANPDVGELFED